MIMVHKIIIINNKILIIVVLFCVVGFTELRSFCFIAITD